MKKNLLLAVFLFLGFCINAQDIEKSAALQLVGKNSEAIGLTNENRRIG